MCRRSPLTLAIVALAGGAVLVGGPLAQVAAQPRVRVKYAFQPDCYRPSLAAACENYRVSRRLDLGPQIAVWVEKADRSQFIDTLLVTSLTATRGIGNRPGAVNFPSSPKFPYGKRPMVLPVWAYARGKLFDTVVMQDVTTSTPDREFWFGFHEAISTPDPYYCRPMSEEETFMPDAITCPTKIFNSAKGRFAPADPKSYYPPRNDLRSFNDRDCDTSPGRANCAISARTFEQLNDLDAVATPTPRYGQPHVGTWLVPPEIPDGDYALWLEISKEFDQNTFHKYPAYTDPNLTDSGIKNNLGQPSVVFRVPFKLSRTVGDQRSVTDISGYGDAAGKTGNLRPPDATISDTPGSGRGRLLSIAQPSIVPGTEPIVGRVIVQTDSPPMMMMTPPSPGPDAGQPPAPTDDGGSAPGATDGAISVHDAGLPLPPPPPGIRCDPVPAEASMLIVPARSIGAEAAQASFVEPVGPAHERIEEYRVRYWTGNDHTPEAFAAGNPAETVSRGAPGQTRSVALPDLKGLTVYTVGVKPTGECVDGKLTSISFSTRERQFTTLSGCFIATAAYGSPLAGQLDALRRLRDRARGAQPGGGFAAAAVSLYERASPPLADLLRDDDAARAVVRAVLGPIVELAGLLGQAPTSPSSR